MVEGGEDLGGVEDETAIRIYTMTKESTFKKRGKEKTCMLNVFSYTSFLMNFICKKNMTKGVE